MSQTPSVTSSPGAPTPSPFTPAQLAELSAAKERAGKIRRAISVATVDAWITAVFAGLSLLCGCFGIANVLVGIPLAWVAYRSFKGAAGLRRFDLKAPADLALNQLVLAAVIILYACYGLRITAAGKSPIAALLVGDTDYTSLGLPGMGASMNDARQIVTFASYALYGGLIVGTILAQGLTARYYASRKKLLVAYLEQTPKWVLDFQKAQAG